MQVQIIHKTSQVHLARDGHPEPPPSQLVRLWQPSSPQVDLQARMQQPRRPETRIPLLPHGRKLGRDDARVHVLVELPLVGDGREARLFARERVVVS